MQAATQIYEDIGHKKDRNQDFQTLMLASIHGTIIVTTTLTALENAAGCVTQAPGMVGTHQKA